MTKGISDFITYFMTAMSNCLLYSEQHPAVSEFSAKAVSALEPHYAEDKISLTILGGSLIVNDVPADDASTQVIKFIKHMRRKGVERIIIKKGITPGELKSFITGFSFSEKLPASEHISAGIVQVLTGAGSDDISALTARNVSRVREAYQGLSKFKTLDMVGLEDVVISFISALRNESDILRIICPVKSYSEYTYTHASNVAVLSIFQAEALGLKGNILHDIGLAGLFHDIGKMFVSKEVLEKKGRLDEKEWAEMKTHPVRSALYLSRLPDTPKLAVIASYEHHMKFNGTGYPQTKKRGKKQHVISQIIAVADFFDAMRTERPYRRSVDTQVILGLMKKGAGTEFNPFLVDNFCLALENKGSSESSKVL